MSKSSSKAPTRHSRRKGGRSSTPKRSISDGAIYLGLTIIGAAVVGFGFLLSPEHWDEITLGYVIAIAWLIHLYAFSVYRGRHLANWKQALARLPLRCVGFGRRGGKPVGAAHGQESAKMMIMVSAALSILFLAALSFVLIK